MKKLQDPHQAANQRQPHWRWSDWRLEPPDTLPKTHNFCESKKKLHKLESNHEKYQTIPN